MLAFVAPHGAYAKLGDTPEAVARAYGQPVDAGKPAKGLTTNIYQRGRIHILVQFSGGKSVAEAYSRVDGKPLSDAQMVRFLKANNGGQFWDPQGGPENVVLRRDKKAEARYSILGGRYTFWVRSL